MSKARILVLEDEAVIAMELESQLQNLGYQVTSVVNTGDKAIVKAEADKPDLMLMDIRIQGDKDGIETAEIIKNRFGIPVAFSTAYLDQERIERAKITMPFGYVLKPIQERDLKVTLEMALYVAKVDAERRKAEGFVKHERNLAQQYLDVAGVLLIALDLSGNVTLINPKGCEILGYEKEEIIGYNWFDKFLLQEGIEEVKKVFNQIITGDIEPVEYYENPIFRKDGSQRFVAWHNSVLRNSSGEIIGLFSSGEDITKRKNAEKALKESENLLHEVINSMEKAIAIYEVVNNGEDFRFVETNEFAEKIMHYKSEDVIGKTLKELFPGEAFLGLVEKFKETYLTGKSTTIPLKQYKDDRITQWVENYIFKTPSGKVVAMFEDTTEKRNVVE
ncbi:PAS domain S-box protein [bacterium]|nr:PAS domain S-box protein [bacterium]